MSDSDDAMGVNPYEIALGKVSSIFPPPPYNYRYRAGVQLALCCVLIALALAYVVLRVAHARGSGTPLWVFKLERGTTRRSARRVKINQMPVFALLALLAGVAQLATRIYTWRVFVQGHPPLHYISAQVLPWLPPFTQAWFFSFTNLQATLAVRGTIGSQWRRTLPPMAHNTLLLGFPLAFMAVVTPMTVITSATENKVIRLCYALIPQLQDASSIWKSGGLPSAAINNQLLAEKIQIIASTNKLVQRIVQLCSVFLAVVSLICLMNLGTLCLVCTLRSTVAADRRRAQENFLENCQPQITSSAPVMQIAQTGNPLGKNNQPTLSHESSGEKLGQIHAPVAFNPTPPMHLCPQTVAMRRLAADLSTTIPCILALALTILVELAILVNRRFMNMTWALQEFTMDSFCYAYCFFNILALSFLIYNLVHAWRAQQAIDPLSTDTKNGESGLRHGRSQVSARKVIVSLVPPARSGSCEEVKSKERVECQ